MKKKQYKAINVFIFSGTAEFQTIRFTEVVDGKNETTAGQDQAFKLTVAVPPREIRVELQEVRCLLINCLHYVEKLNYIWKIKI